MTFSSKLQVLLSQLRISGNYVLRKISLKNVKELLISEILIEQE